MGSPSTLSYTGILAVILPPPVSDPLYSVRYCVRHLPDLLSRRFFLPIPFSHWLPMMVSLGLWWCGLVTKSCPTLTTPWTMVCQTPLSMGFSRQEYWSGLPFPSPGDFPDPGIEPRSPALQADSLPTELRRKPYQWAYIQTIHSPRNPPKTAKRPRSRGFVHDSISIKTLWASCDLWPTFLEFFLTRF